MKYIASKIKSVELRIKNGFNMLEYSRRYEPTEVSHWKEEKSIWKLYIREEALIIGIR